MPFYTHDNVPDSPINNFCTLNRLSFAATNNLLNGNLQADLSSTNSGAKPNIILPKTGSWYAEFYALQVTGGGGYSTAGIMEASKLGWHGGPEISTPQSYSYDNSNFRDGAVEMGQTSIFTASNHSYNSGFGRISTGGVYGLLWNSDLKKFSILHNSNVCSVILAYDDIYDLVFHVSQSYGNATDKHIFNFGQDPSFGGAKSPTTTYPDANGLGQFHYQPPAGALALCTANLPEGPIKLSQDQTPSDYFKTVTYSGNGATQSITGVGFQPDLVWAKSRSGTTGNASPALYDSVRGAGANKELTPSQTYAEGMANSLKYGYISTLDVDGFGIGAGSINSIQINSSSTNYVAWCWKAAGSPAENQAKIINEDGSDGTMSTADLKASTGASITPSKMSVNRQNGFSIVKYTGTGSSATVPHGLNSAPEMIICKTLDQSIQWVVYHKDTGPDGFLGLNTTSSFSNDTDYWGTGTGVTNTSFGLQNAAGGNNHTSNLIAYCWHSVDGYSKFGSYTGNNSADGPFVYTGFRVGWLMVKDVDTNGVWVILDNKRSEFNVVAETLFPNLANQESSLYDQCDFLSNGFKWRADNTNSWPNHISGNRYIFMAFAEQPFSGPSNAR